MGDAVSEEAAEAFGALLRRHRRAAGLTQEALAEKTGLSVRAISGLERGEGHAPRPDTVRYLSGALGLSGAELELFERTARLHAPDERERPDGAAAAFRGGPGAHPVAPATPLIGREATVAEASSLLRGGDIRLLSVLGPGGVGKTRVALRVVEELRPEFSEGAVVVGLETVADPALVPEALVRALRLRDDGFAPPLELLLAHLREKEVLLLLDNFEQVVGAAPMLTRLLEGSPRLKMLVTSRVSLRVREAQEFPVPPLEVPGPTENDVERAARNPTVKLFLDRARAADPSFKLDEGNSRTIAEICRRLEGIPLAVELAAARTKLLPPGALLARLESGLALLAGGGPDLPQRQRTMRQTVAWSEDLLGEHERAIFRRLAVFSGGATLEAIEAVCPSEAATSPAGQVDALDGLSSLLDASLLGRVADPDGGPRLTMLQTLREYASERLRESGEEEDTRVRHAAYYLAMAEAAEPRLDGRDQEAWLRRLDSERGNLQQALRWAREGADLEVGFRLSGALRRYWWSRGYIGEGRAWIDGLLNASPSDRTASKAARAKALFAAGQLAYAQGDNGRAVAPLEEALALRREIGDEEGATLMLAELGQVVRRLGDHRRAEDLSEEGLAASRALGLRLSAAVCLNTLGRIARRRGDADLATARHEESLALFRELEDGQGVAYTLASLGLAALERGETKRAIALHEESLGRYERLRDRAGRAFALVNLGDAARASGNAERAGSLYESALAVYTEIGNSKGASRAHQRLKAVERPSKRPRSST